MKEDETCGSSQARLNARYGTHKKKLKLHKRQPLALLLENQQMSNQLLNDTELPQLIPTCSQTADRQPPCSFSQNQQKFARTSKRKISYSESSRQLARYSRQDSRQFTLERNPTLTLQQLSANTVDETINESDFDCLRAGFFLPSPRRLMFPQSSIQRVQEVETRS
jgi:hypothetical protein